MVNTNRCRINISILSIYMKVEELENFNPISNNLPGAWLIIKASDNGANPNWFPTNDKIKKTFIIWYKRKQILDLDEVFKSYDTSSLKKISTSIGLKKHPKNRNKLIYQMKEKIMKKDWKSIDKLYKRIKRN